MADNQKHFSVNWIDGMKVNKNHFISQDNAWKESLFRIGSLNTSPVRFGILPVKVAGEENFNVKLSVDNQNILRVSVLACQAVTPGGVRINLHQNAGFASNTTDGIPALSFPFTGGRSQEQFWVVLTVNPFERIPSGEPDYNESPPRYPYVLPGYAVEIVSDAEFGQYSFHPYAITIGKVIANGNNVRVDNDYIPPSYSISASPDLVNLHAELDQFMARLEVLCSLIVQKILQKKQQNDISELVMFLCDRMILFLGQAISSIRWTMIHESPAEMFTCVAALARVMKNTIDLRTGTGKEEMLNYFSEWSELNQGDLDGMLMKLAEIRYDNNDVNRNIAQIVEFVRITSRLFEKLNGLDFIGKKNIGRGPWIPGTADQPQPQPQPQPVVPRRRFFGND